MRVTPATSIYKPPKKMRAMRGAGFGSKNDLYLLGCGDKNIRATKALLAQID
jgi:hypothetical protein